MYHKSNVPLLTQQHIVAHMCWCLSLYIVNCGNRHSSFVWNRICLIHRIRLWVKLWLEEPEWCIIISWISSQTIQSEAVWNANQPEATKEINRIWGWYQSWWIRWVPAYLLFLFACSLFSLNPLCFSCTHVTFLNSWFWITSMNYDCLFFSHLSINISYCCRKANKPSSSATKARKTTSIHYKCNFRKICEAQG